MTARAIGIDLGTTYTVVATVEAGRPRIIPNAEGQQLTPSVVCFAGEGEPLVGEPARRRAASEPEKAVYSIKRRMGSSYTFRAGDREYSPQEVSGFILGKVKRDAESYLGERIGRAVLTVPAYFNERQRQATKEAGALAGLEVIRMVHEPTAAALAYGLHREEARTVLVWDLGGGTFDVSILELGEGIFEVRAVSGDTRLGGDDWDSRIADYLAEEHSRACLTDVPNEPGARQRLKEVAERAKIELSFCPVTRVQIPSMGSCASKHLEVDLTRERLEGLTQELLHRMVGPTKQALADSGLSADGIDRVLLVGGATRMPAVRRLAREMLGKEPYRYIEPDGVVAMGAAIQAAMALGIIDRAVLLDVLPLSLGIETQGGLVARLIRRNTPLPASGTRIFTTAVDYQASMEIHIVQGERELAEGNVSLGRFHLTGIPLAPRGIPKVEVALEVDLDGISQLTARELLGGAEMTVSVTSTKFLDSAEIRQMADEAHRMAPHDREARERITAGIEASQAIAAAEAALKQTASPEKDPQAREVVQATERLKKALASGATLDVKGQTRNLGEKLGALLKERGGSPGS